MSRSFRRLWLLLVPKMPQSPRFQATAVLGALSLPAEVPFSVRAPLHLTAADFPAIRLRDRHLGIQNAEKPSKMRLSTSIPSSPGARLGRISGGVKMNVNDPTREAGGVSRRVSKSIRTAVCWARRRVSIWNTGSVRNRSVASAMASLSPKGTSTCRRMILPQALVRAVAIGCIPSSLVGAADRIGTVPPRGG